MNPVGLCSKHFWEYAEYPLGRSSDEDDDRMLYPDEGEILTTTVPDDECELCRMIAETR